MSGVAKVYRHHGDRPGRLRVLYKRHFLMWSPHFDAWIECSGNAFDLTLLYISNNFEPKGQIMLARDSRAGRN